MKKLFLLLPLMLLSLVSCDNEEPISVGPNQTVIGFSKDTVTANFSVEVPTETLKVPLNLIGYNNETYPSDVIVTYNILSESTATAGVEYEVPSSLTATLTSGSSADYLEIPVNPSTFDPQNPKYLVLEMVNVNTGNAIIGLNNKKVLVYLQGVCSSNLQGGYSTQTTRLATGAQYLWNAESLSKTDIFKTEYITEFVGNFVGAGQNPPNSGAYNNLPATTNAGYKFTDVCGKLKVESQNLGGVYSNLVLQSAAEYNNSFVDPDTGVITVYYTVTLSSGNRAYRSVYTPLP